MIARFFPCARHGIDRDLPYTLGDVEGGENVVNAQAVVLFKTSLAIIPPAVGFGRVQTERPGVHKTGFDQPFKCLSFGR